MGCCGSKAEPATPEPGSVAFGPSAITAAAGVTTAVDEPISRPTTKPQPYHPPPSAPPASEIVPQPTSRGLAHTQKETKKLMKEEKKLVDEPAGAPPPPATTPTPKPKSSSKLTAEQQAQWEAKRKLIVEQLAKPSKWDTPFKGRGKYADTTVDLNASACKQALRCTKFLDAAHLAKLADEGQPVPRCQDVPPEAVVTLQEMEESGLLDECRLLSVLIISYPWLDADHPDVDGAQLRRLAFVLKAFANKAGEKKGGKCGVFWDYCSLPQRSMEAHRKGRASAAAARAAAEAAGEDQAAQDQAAKEAFDREDDRTPEERDTFKQGLLAVNLWYGHPLTSVLLVDTPLPEGEWTNLQPYGGRGWCRMEHRASAMVKNWHCLISLSALTGEEKDWDEVDRAWRSRARRLPPMSPPAFAVMLEEGVASGEIKFTNSGDVGLVCKIYERAFMAEMSNCTELDNPQMTHWDDAAGMELCEALRYAHAHGGLTKLKRLTLDGSRIGDGFVKSFVALLDEGGLAGLKRLSLISNPISEQGMQELAAAIARGGLPSCTSLWLGGNPGFVAPVEEVLKQRMIKRLKALEMQEATKLSINELHNMKWDDAAGAELSEALRYAHAHGGLTKLKSLEIEGNQLGDGFIKSFVALLDEGGLAGADYLDLRENAISEQGMQELAAAIARGGLPSCKYMALRGNPGGEAPVQEAFQQRKK